MGFQELEKMINGFIDYHNLTPRQGEILQLVVFKGYSNEQLSDHFKISKKTIGNHMYELMRKLECCSSREVMSMVFNYTANMEKKNNNPDR